MQKSILFLMFLLILQSTTGQVINKNNGNETLDEYLQLLFNDIDDNIEGVIDSNGGKVTLQSTSEAVNFNIYDFETNKKYIVDIFELFEVLSNINDDLEMLRAFGNSSFHQSFNQCDCRAVPLRVIDLYKSKYSSTKLAIKDLKVLAPQAPTVTSREINALIEIISKKIDAFDEKEINKRINPNKLNQIIAYISKDVIPHNSKKINELSTIINQLKLKLSVYIATVNLLN